MVSTNNPFRTAVTPNPTGTSNTRPDADSRTNSSPGEPSTSADSSMTDLLNEELPPAYTPAPNVYEGEATLELGPRRPFQQPQRVPSQRRQQFPPQEWGISSQPNGSWSGYPGHMHREQTVTQYVPPPTHPSLARPLSSPTSPSTSSSNHLSDFARDFYAAGGGDSELYGGSSAQYQNDIGASSPSSSSRRHAPPPGEPPHRSKADPSSPSVTDDRRPTDRPVPGRPLLRHGKVLMYPPGYECQKCHNTGYRNYDPSYPCTRCWDKYAKSYSGAITYAPWSAEGESSTFQRPLPNFRSPQSSLHTQSASWSGPTTPNADLSRSASTSRLSQPQTNGYPGTSAARIIPVAGGALPMSPYLDRLGNGGGRPAFPPPSWGQPGQLSGIPPTSGNIAVFPPGDPRIGGRLCWRCGGKGKTSFLIFDEETCGICNGVGRTFV